VLSVLQLCEMSYNCLFTNKGVTVFRRSDGSFAFKDILRGKLYLMDFVLEAVELDKCLIAKRNMGWLCHHSLAHVVMRNIHKLQDPWRCFIWTYLILSPTLALAVTNMVL
jgi:hypothetical protein